MQGLKLSEMELSDMLDVIHFMYEEDYNYATVEQAQMAEARRIQVFEGMYNQEYKYKVFDQKQNSSNQDLFDEDGELKPFNPNANETKPYIPPTEFNPNSGNPFGDILDAPIG